jgi:hypothetical protein
MSNFSGTVCRLHRDVSDHQSAQNQQHHLDDVGQGDGFEAAIERIADGECGEQPQRVGDIQAGDGVDRQRAEPQDRGEVDEHVNAEPEECQHCFDAAVVTLLEKLRHRVNLVLQEYRQQVFADDDERNRGHPFIGCDRDAQYVGRAGHADDLFCGDVCSNQ